MAQRARLGSGRSTFLAEPGGLRGCNAYRISKPGRDRIRDAIRFANSLRGDKRSLSARPWAEAQCCTKATQLRTKPLKRKGSYLGLLNAKAKKILEKQRNLEFQFLLVQPKLLVACIILLTQI